METGRAVAAFLGVRRRLLGRTGSGRPGVLVRRSLRSPVGPSRHDPLAALCRAARSRRRCRSLRRAGVVRRSFEGLGVPVLRDDFARNSRCHDQRRPRRGLLRPVRFDPILSPVSADRSLADRVRRILHRIRVGRSGQRNPMGLDPQPCCSPRPRGWRGADAVDHFSSRSCLPLSGGCEVDADTSPGWSSVMAAPLSRSGWIRAYSG